MRFQSHACDCACGSVGEFEAGFESNGQTKEHAFLARGLGVNQVPELRSVNISKSLTISYSYEYRSVRSMLTTWLRACISATGGSEQARCCGAAMGPGPVQCHQGPTAALPRACRLQGGQSQVRSCAIHVLAVRSTRFAISHCGLRIRGRLLLTAIADMSQ